MLNHEGELNGENAISIFIIIIGLLLIITLTLIGVLHKRKITNNYLRILLWVTSHGLAYSAVFMTLNYLTRLGDAFIKNYFSFSKILFWVILLFSPWIFSYFLFHPYQKHSYYHPYFNIYLDLPIMPSYTLFVAFGFMASLLVQLIIFRFLIISILIYNIALVEILLLSGLLWRQGKILEGKNFINATIALQIFSPIFTIILLYICGFFTGTLIIVFVLGCIEGLAMHYAVD